MEVRGQLVAELEGIGVAVLPSPEISQALGAQ
jgi:hypothetical protein